MTVKLRNLECLNIVAAQSAVVEAPQQGSNGQESTWHKFYDNNKAAVISSAALGSAAAIGVGLWYFMSGKQVGIFIEDTNSTNASQVTIDGKAYTLHQDYLCNK